MSKRTADSNKAVANAWKKEKELVGKGQGTRDWTPDQQKDILNKGKAYDDNGKAFEGQHMKSVEKYPEFQNDWENIQFLTREEHKEAHHGNWKNPTNWYYDPLTKQYTDYGEGKYIPCEIIKLSDPIMPYKDESNDLGKDDSEEKPSSNTEKKAIKAKVDPPIKTKSANTKLREDKPITPKKESVINKLGENIKEGTKFVGNKIKQAADFISENPEILLKVGEAIINIATATTYVDSENIENNNTTTNYDGFDFEDYIPSSSNSDDEIKSRKEPVTHESPREHIVPKHSQHYHTKKGLIEKEKAAYPRGKKKKKD